MTTDKFKIDYDSSVAYYKQIIDYFEKQISSGAWPSGKMVPSMNEFSRALDISKETVKKAYDIMRERGILKSIHGKGFFVEEQEKSNLLRILLLMDKISISKQALLNSFVDTLKGKAKITIQLHGQNPEILKYFIDTNLYSYDYYVVTPHFSLDAATHKAVVRQLKRIPNRHLILLDRNIEDLPGKKYGSVYQDYATDAYYGLSEGLDKLRQTGKLNVITSPSSLYHTYVENAVRQFSQDYNIPAEFYDHVSPEIIKPGETYLLLNGQLDINLINAIECMKEKGLQPGRDISLISYNESPICKVIQNGLTTISTDFEKMGRLAAEMILSGTLRQVKNDFHMFRRESF